MSRGRSAADDRRTAGTTRRRAMLAAAGAATLPLSGCARRVRSIVNREGVDPLSLTITTVPADGDRESIRLTREIAAALERAGIDVEIEMRSNEEFLRAVLLNHDYDLYVGRHPGGFDPDFLYEALHSLYAEESGWQNPFGYTNLTVDGLLEEQREATGEDRREAVETALEAVAVEQPFVPICVPEEYRLVRTDRIDGWATDHLADRFGYLGLEAGPDVERLRATYVDARPSENLNPLMAEYRDTGPVVDLLYDSLGAVREGDVEPWLAEEWDRTDDELTVTLRDDCRFHDGEPLTADDVVFTYAFIADTTMGEGPATSPASIYRGRVSAAGAVDAVDDRTVAFDVDVDQAVAEYALTVPILPRHVWKERSSRASIPGLRVAQGTTEALVTDNVPPVGSGPYRFDGRTERDHVTLERFDDHFTRRSGVDLPEPTVPELRIRIDPRSTSAVELVSTDDADVTATPLETYVVDDVIDRAAEDADLELLESPSRPFYHLGFNARRAPFGNPRFRRALARLIDKAWLVEDVFEGYARPIATPVGEEWRPASLEWNGEDPETPFLGTDGEVDVDAARETFEEAGFRYDADGNLRVRQ